MKSDIRISIKLSMVLNLIQRGLKKSLKSLKFYDPEPVETLQSQSRPFSFLCVLKHKLTVHLLCVLMWGALIIWNVLLFCSISLSDMLTLSCPSIWECTDSQWTIKKLTASSWGMSSVLVSISTRSTTSKWAAINFLINITWIPCKLVIPSRNSVTFISWKNSFSDISRKCILPKND